MSFPVNKERHGCITSKQEVAILIYKFLKDEGYSSTIDSFRRECVYVKKPPKLVREICIQFFFTENFFCN
jgi:hypothetical protein